MRKKIISFVIAALMLIGIGTMLIPTDVSAWSGDNSAWRVWMYDPIGGRNAYRNGDYVSQAVMNQALVAVNRPPAYKIGAQYLYNYSTGAVEYTPNSGVSYPDCVGNAIGLAGVKYGNQDGYEWGFECQDAVEVFLRDFVGFLGTNMAVGGGIGKSSAQGYWENMVKWDSTCDGWEPFDSSASVHGGTLGYYFYDADGYRHKMVEPKGTYPAIKVPTRTNVKSWAIAQEAAGKLRPGALVCYFGDKYGDGTNWSFTHVAIYAGNGQVFESSGGKTQIRDLPTASIGSGNKGGSPVFFANLTRDLEAEFKVRKVSSQPEYNSTFSMVGAQFTLYTDAACTIVAKDVNNNNVVLTIGSNLESNTVKVKTGTYYLKETVVPQRYLPSVTSVAVNIQNTNEVNIYTFTNNLQVGKGKVQKIY